MKNILCLLLVICSLPLLFSLDASAKCKKKVGVAAPKPLYRDPVCDGAADPVIIWNKQEKKWFMLYTNRRANDPSLEGVTWVHGTRIGIAESKDGANWTYRDTADIQYRLADYTHWAPEVIEHQGIYHMYLTYVPGIFNDWKHPREIMHLTSSNMINWKYESTLTLASDKVIDACVFQLPDGTWRMWYNNEKAGKSMFYADSPDLYNWTDKGRVVSDQGGEGPKVFQWKGKYWMITDVWKGLALYQSSDLLSWIRIPGNLLQQPGIGLDDQVKGGHADVVVSGDRAYIYYFTHPGRRDGVDVNNILEQRRSSIQVVELKLVDGVPVCNREETTYVRLLQPKGK